MPATVINLGPGTLTLGSTPVDFSCEMVGGQITHEYEEVSESRTRLCGDVIAASETRNDGFSGAVENDLTAAGMYKYLVDNDLQVVPFEFTPNNTAGAKWAGNIVAKLPGSIGADEFGAPIASEVEWAAVGNLTFTPAV